VWTNMPTPAVSCARTTVTRSSSSRSLPLPLSRPAEPTVTVSGSALGALDARVGSVPTHAIYRPRDDVLEHGAASVAEAPALLPVLALHLFVGLAAHHDVTHL